MLIVIGLIIVGYIIGFALLAYGYSPDKGE